jgi:uptake hydrogenase large subunit
MATGAPGPGLAGALKLSATVSERGFADVQLKDTRPAHIGAALAGRPFAEGLKLAGLILPVCGMAHQAAALEAYESHCGISLSAQHLIARRMLVAAEAAINHGWRLTVSWPALLERAPKLDTVARLRGHARDLAQALHGHAAAMVVGGGTLRLDPAGIRRAVAAIADDLSMIAGLDGEPCTNTPESFGQWLAEGLCPPQQLAARILDFGVEDFGVHDLPHVEQFTDPLLSHWVETGQQPMAEFSAPGQATWAEISRTIGAGLLGRLARCVSAVTKLVDDLNADKAALLHGAESGSGTVSSHPGLGVVMTARGPLAHHLSCNENDEVIAWRLSSPTDGSFHTHGPLVRALAQASSVRHASWATRALVTLMDPCVPCAVTIREAADA